MWWERALNVTNALIPRRSNENASSGTVPGGFAVSRGAAVTPSAAGDALVVKRQTDRQTDVKGFLHYIPKKKKNKEIKQ
ncbi:hypothetical protein O3P69_012856 [Scylla paramamosain]|uniref:Uncharacterized protein n=1 Tax=Scylla paramamosain TaxID=85552 RepID=A0AAW0TTA6_SCYPA